MTQDVVGLEIAAFDDIADARHGRVVPMRGEPMPVRTDIRPALHRAIDELSAGLVEMSDRVVAALQVCASVLEGRPADTGSVMGGEEHINALHNRIRHDVLRLLTTQAPLARDLRCVLTALLVDEELERMGDHCVSIVKQSVHLDVAPLAVREALGRMAGVCVEQVTEISTCIAARDSARARNIAARDDDVDRAYHRIIDRLLEGDGHGAAPSVVLVAHHLERIGDRVTNIAEHLVFAVEGEIVELG